MPDVCAQTRARARPQMCAKARYVCVCVLSGLKWDERRTYCQNIEAVQDQNTWAARNGYNIQNQ